MSGQRTEGQSGRPVDCSVRPWSIRASLPGVFPRQTNVCQRQEQNELRHLDRGGIFWLLQARAKASGLEKKACVHSFEPLAEPNT